MSTSVYIKPTQKEISQRKLEAYDKYCQVINWGRAYPVEFASRFFGIELLDNQKYAIYNSWTKDFVLWLESRNAGKALALDTIIPTPNGYTTMGELKVGDYVFNEKGEPTKVVYTSEIFLGHDCYEVEFEDGEKIVADADHLWNVIDEDGDSTVANTRALMSTLSHKVIGVPSVCSTNAFKRIISIRKTNSVPTKCIQVDNPRKLYLCGKKNTVTHNTTQIAIYTMLRSTLIPLHATYFLGNTGDQAKETFKKIEKIAKKEIESFTGCTDVFYNEILNNSPTGDGFSHDPGSFKFKMFNGSEVFTLNSDVTNIKGRRANLVCFDEAGWFSDELFVQAENFVNQDENFKLGGGIDITLEPKGFPRQLLYASSASDTDSGFYKKFRLFSDQMIMGDKKYFVCNFDINLVMQAKFNGEPYPPLLSKDKVDKAMSDNREKALRELYNKFSADSHEGQILTRREIMQYTERRPPLLTNDTGNRQFALAWDSARINDNSVIEVAEFRLDKDKGWCMDFQNLISLVDIGTKKKTPMRLPEQVKKFQDTLLEYNGSEKQRGDYENIKSVICDSGAGGQMIGGVSDYMLEDWLGRDGNMHRGIIDSSHKANETAKEAYPNAIDIMQLVDPKGHRNEIFDAIERMVKLGVVTFPADYDGKDVLVSIDDAGNEVQYDLSQDEQIALAQIELLKTEIITMCKYISNGNVTYNFPPDKRNKMHDDRVFAFGLLCWYLAQLRRNQIVNVQNDEADFPDTSACVSEVTF